MEFEEIIINLGEVPLNCKSRTLELQQIAMSYSAILLECPEQNVIITDDENADLRIIVKWMHSNKRKQKSFFITDWIQE